MPNVRRLLWGLIGVAAMAMTSQAENWPGWRGPRGDGSSEEAKVPVVWS